MDKRLRGLMKAVHKNNLGSLEDLLREYEASEESSGESRLKTESLVNMLCKTSGDSLCHVAAQHGFLDILRLVFCNCEFKECHLRVFMLGGYLFTREHR